MSFALSHLGALLVLAGVLHETGRLCADALRAPPHPALGAALSRLALGLLLWPPLLFLLASVGLYRPTVIGALALAAVLVAPGRALRTGGLGALPASLIRLRARALVWLRDGSAVRDALTAAAPAAILLPCAVLALGQQVGWDDDVYHLTLPKLYAQHGGFRPVPYSLYANWPHGVELLYGAAAMLYDHVLAKLVHTLYLALLCATLYRLAREHTGRAAALIAVLLLLCNDVVLYEARLAYVDIAFAFYLLLAVAWAVELLRTDDHRALLLCGLACGMVAATKLSGLVALACVGLIVAGRLWATRPAREAVRGALRAGLWLSLATAALALPWYAKSYLYTGDPLHPMLYAHFGGREWSAELGARFFAWQHAIGMGRSALDYLALPWRIVMESGPGYARFAGSLGDFWLVAGPLALLGALRVPAARPYVACGLLYSVFWATSSQQLRFFIAALPLLAIGAALGLQRLIAAREQLRFLLVGGALIGIAATGVVEVRPTLDRALAFVTQRLEQGPERLEAVIPEGHAYVNRATPPDAKLLLLNLNRGYFLEREYIADSAFEASQMAWLLGHADSPRAGAALLARHGITHVYESTRDWGVRYPDWLQTFLRDRRFARRVYRCREDRCRIYELKPQSARDAS